VTDALGGNLALSAREVAYGFAYGEDAAGALPVGASRVKPIDALEQAILPALRRAPCVVGFSGGRDSSAVLAVATRLARREGLALPIPVTMRFPWAPASGESEWQERVVNHLGLTDWERVEPGALDLIGPVAARGLRKHGLLWPANVHSQIPVIERAPGGSVLTGLDGDAIFGGWPWARLASVLTFRVVPEPRDVLRLARAAAPRAVRRWLARRRSPDGDRGGAWLRPEARQGFERELAIDASPRRWDGHIEQLARERYLTVGSASLQALADDTDTLMVHPFLDRRFLAALRDAGGAFGWGDQTATTAAVFGDLLPSETVARASKAAFDDVFWSDQSREFARDWDGEGVAQELVDPEALRSEWLAEIPDFRTATLLQATWLARQERADERTAAPLAEGRT
jgi:hypothetical protein